MEKRGIPIRKSWRSASDALLLPRLVFVAGDEYSLVSIDDGSQVMEIGEECRDEKRLDAAVNLLVVFLHDEGATQHDILLAAQFIQIAYRFAYNKNTVQGMFFYYKMNEIKNGNRYKEAMALARKPFSVDAAETLVEICLGIII